MTKKQTFSVQQHKQCGAELMQIRMQLLDMAKLISETYPHDIAKKQASSALQAVDLLRTDLENIYCREHPRDRTPPFAHSYYGAAK